MIQPQAPRRILHSLQPVRNRNHRALGQLRPQDSLHRRSSGAVNGRSRLVENDKTASPEDGSGDANKLPLSLAEILARSVYMRVQIPLRPEHAVDRVSTLLVGKVGTWIDVIAQSSGEESGILLDEGDAVPQGRAVDLRQIDAAYFEDSLKGCLCHEKGVGNG